MNETKRSFGLRGNVMTDTKKCFTVCLRCLESIAHCELTHAFQTTDSDFYYQHLMQVD